MGDTNTQGRLLFELISRTDLFAVSLCQMSSGPSYTYFNSEHCTTVDNCFLDNHAAQCTTLDYHPLNLSNHLPISANLDLISLSQIRSTTPSKINWKKATLKGPIMTYQQRGSTESSHLPTHQCDSSPARPRNLIWCYSHPEGCTTHPSCV